MNFKNLTYLLILLNIILAPAQATEKDALALVQFTSIDEISNSKKLVSIENRPISVIRFFAADKHGKKIKARHKFYVQGGLHGNEQMTVKFVEWLVSRYMRGKSQLNKLSVHQAAFDFIPRANPDGLKEKNRYNSRNANLNRNFDYLWGLSRENPGEFSFSEPETQAIKYMMEKEKYTAAVDVHGYINWIVAPSAPMTSTLKTSEAAHHYTSWMRFLKDQIKLLGSYELKTAYQLGDGGAFEDWVFWKNETFALCLEMESPFRFKIDREQSTKRIDRYKLYEKFIYRAFKKAIELKDQELLATNTTNAQVFSNKN